MTKGFCPRILSLFLLVLALFVNIRGQSTPQKRFVIWDERGKFGYIDETGHVVIKPQFDYAYPFSEGLAAVGIGDKAGFIDSSGRAVIPFQYYRTASFSDSVAAVYLSGGGNLGSFPCGYIDHSNNYVIKPPNEFRCSRFQEGFADVEIYDQQIGEWLGTYINKKGQQAVRSRLAVGKPFSEGVALVEDFTKWSFVNREGQTEIDLRPKGRSKPTDERLEPASSFSEGLAMVGITVDGTSGHSRFGFMDRSGKLVFRLPFNIRAEGDFHDGRAQVYVAMSQTVRTLFDNQIYVQEENVSARGYIDKTGKTVIQPRFSRVEDFSEGLAVVRVGKGLPVDDYNITPERWATVYKDNEAKHYTCIDRDGNVVIEKCGVPLTRDEIGENFREFGRAFGRGFVDGLFFSKTEMRVGETVTTVYGYMNRAGKFVWIQPAGTEIKPRSR
jgi:WG containing repeat